MLDFWLIAAFCNICTLSQLVGECIIGVLVRYPTVPQEKTLKIMRKDEDTVGKKEMIAGYIRNQLYEEENDELDYNEGAHATAYGQ